MRWFRVVPFIMLSAPAFAQQALPAQVYACANIEDAAQRHACFDALVPELKRAGGAAPASKAPAAASRAAAAQSPLTAPVLTAEEKAAAKSVEKEKEKEVERVTLPIKAIDTGSDGKYRFTMENGQIWRQVDSIKLRNLGKGPWWAEVREAALGGYMLKVEKQTAVRVERMN